MKLKDFHWMVQAQTGMLSADIELDWEFIQSYGLIPDWQFYHDCWFVDGEKPWNDATKVRVNNRYMAGQTTKDPFAFDNNPPGMFKIKPQQRKERRILNA